MHRAFGGIWEEDVENQDGDPVLGRFLAAQSAGPLGLGASLR